MAASSNDSSAIKGEPVLISFYCNKGGVGKTTALHNVAYILAEDFGLRVLAVDADVQCNLSYSLFKSQPPRSPDEVNDPHEEEQMDEKCTEFYESLTSKDADSRRRREQRTIYECFRTFAEKEEVRDEILMSKAKDVQLARTVYKNLSFLPGDLRFSDIVGLAEVAIRSSADASTFRLIPFLTNYLRAIAREHGIQVVLLDLNPALSAVNAAFIVGADYFCVPVYPDAYTLQGVTNLADKIPQWVEATRIYRAVKVEEFRLRDPAKFLGYFALRFPSYKQKSTRADVVQAYDDDWRKIDLVMNGRFLDQLRYVTQQEDFYRAKEAHAVALRGIEGAGSATDDDASQKQERVVDDLHAKLKELQRRDHRRLTTNLMLTDDFYSLYFGIKDFATHGARAQDAGRPISDVDFVADRGRLTDEQKSRAHFNREFKTLTMFLLSNMTRESLCTLGLADYHGFALSGAIFGPVDREHLRGERCRRLRYQSGEGEQDEQFDVLGSTSVNPSYWSFHGLPVAMQASHATKALQRKLFSKDGTSIDLHVRQCVAEEILEFLLQDVVKNLSAQPILPLRDEAKRLLRNLSEQLNRKSRSARQRFIESCGLRGDEPWVDDFYGIIFYAFESMDGLSASQLQARDNLLKELLDIKKEVFRAQSVLVSELRQSIQTDVGKGGVVDKFLDLMRDGKRVLACSLKKEGRPNAWLMRLAGLKLLDAILRSCDKPYVLRIWQLSASGENRLEPLFELGPKRVKAPRGSAAGIGECDTKQLDVLLSLGDSLFRLMLPLTRKQINLTQTLRDYRSLMRALRADAIGERRLPLGLQLHARYDGYKAGDCLFDAIAHLLNHDEEEGITGDFLRFTAVNTLRFHPAMQETRDAIDIGIRFGADEDALERQGQPLFRPGNLQKYFDYMQEPLTYGTNAEVHALALHLRRPIHVLMLQRRENQETHLPENVYGMFTYGAEQPGEALILHYVGNHYEPVILREGFTLPQVEENIRNRVFEPVAIPPVVSVPGDGAAEAMQVFGVFPGNVATAGADAVRAANLRDTAVPTDKRRRVL